jgi:hypothetical protein
MKQRRYQQGLRGHRNGRWVEEFFRWLCGADVEPFRAEARLFSALLPEGIRDASVESLCRAVSSAVLEHGREGGSILRFVFSSLTYQDQVKAEAVFGSVAAATSRTEIASLVRTAVLTRPRLAAAVVGMATARVPEETARIVDAASSVVVGPRLRGDEVLGALRGGEALGVLPKG